MSEPPKPPPKPVRTLSYGVANPKKGAAAGGRGKPSKSGDS